jgi:hypothetical protein
MVPGNSQIIDDIFANIRKEQDEMSLPEAASFGDTLVGYERQTIWRLRHDFA